MNFIVIRRAAVVALAAGALFAAPASAFNIIGSSANNTAGPLLPPTTLPANGIFRHWDLREFDYCNIPYSINNAGTGDIAGTGAFDAVESAANSWTNVTPALVGLLRQANTATALPGMDGINLITWDNNNNSGLFPTNPSSILGLTSIFTQVATGRILESDIVFNDRDYQWNNNRDNLVDVRSGTQPFAVNNAQTLTIRVDGGAAQTVTFAAVTNGAATANEIGQNIINQVAGVNVFIVGGNRVRVTSTTHNGTGTINVTGGTAAAAIGFPGGAIVTDAADVESIALHELGHFLGLHHSSNASPEPNAIYSGAVMYWAAPDTGSKRVLTLDDTNGLNFLYTPDLGDAPDDGTQKYQTFVHTTVNTRTLNGIQLHAPGTGPEHLFGYFGQDTLRFEWLGPVEDGSDQECEARVVNNDASDDGIVLPFPMFRGTPNVVTVNISYRNAARYNSAVPGQRLMFNGYFDWNNDKVFDNSDLVIWWTGDPTAGTFSSSPNWSSADYTTAGLIKLTFVVTPPVGAPSTYGRFRLDLGEDEGRVANINADLGPAVGAAQFGEVEDYYVATTNPVVATQVGRFDAQPTVTGVDLSWSTPVGGVSTQVNLYRSVGDAGNGEELLGTVDAGPDGGHYHDANVTAGVSYTYRLGLFDVGGEVKGPSVVVAMPGADFSLRGFSPNPVDRTSVVVFSLPAAGRASLALYSVNGRRVRTIADGVFEAGTQHLAWNRNDARGDRLAPGVYFLKLTYGAQSRVTRTVLLR